MKRMKSMMLSLAMAVLMTMAFLPISSYAEDAVPDGSQDNPWVLEYGQSLAMDTETYPDLNSWRVSNRSTSYLSMSKGEQSVTVENINGTEEDKEAQVVYGTGGGAKRFYIWAKAEDADEIKLTFHKNYNVDDPIFDTVTVGNHQTAMIPSEGPERENYTFVGWAMSSTGEAELYPGQDYQVEKLGTPEITFYAVWGQNSSNLILDIESLTALSDQVTYDGTPHELSGVQEGTADANGYLKVGTYTTTGVYSRTYDAYANISQVKVTATNGGIYHTPVGSAPIYYYRTTRPTGMVRVTGSYIPVTKGELKIDPIEISVKTESATKDADGTPLTADGQISYKVGDTDYAETFGHTDTRIMLIGEDYITIRTSGEQTAPGTYKNGYEYTLEGTSSGNYFVNAEKDELGTLHIHGWSEPVYTWTDDNSKVGAIRRCSACDEAEVEEVRTTSEVAQKQSCEKPEITVWWSDPFKNPAFEPQTKKVETKKAKGHVWDAGKVTKKSSTTATGVKTYTCKVCTATKTETIPKAVKPAKTTIRNTVSNTIAATKYMDVIYDAVPGATGYDVAYKHKNSSKWAVRSVGKTTVARINGLSVSGLYEVKVRAKKAETATNYAAVGDWSSSVSRYFYTTKKIRLKSKSKGSFTMSWAEDAGATGYQVMFSTNSNGKGAANNINTVGKNATSFTKKGLKSGQTYYVQVRTLKKVGNITYIGNISTPVAVKVK